VAEERNAGERGGEIRNVYITVVGIREGKRARWRLRRSRTASEWLDVRCDWKIRFSSCGLVLDPVACFCGRGNEPLVCVSGGIFLFIVKLFLCVKTVLVS
jgi:hypothetical protein